KEASAVTRRRHDQEG
ncbi:hypothetical protein AB1N83_014387, partial [Pleurotus pulmonarius]